MHALLLGFFDLDLISVYNYMHFFGSGHYAYYGKKRKNLALYQQQGVEAVQGIHQTFALRNTQRNGRIGREKIQTSVMSNLIRLLKRKVGLKKISQMPLKPSVFQPKKIPQWIKYNKK